MKIQICEGVKKIEPLQLGNVGCSIKVIVYSKIEYAELNHHVE
jgi:hypothetical protein